MAYFRPILLGLQTIVPLHLVEKLLAHYPHADLQSCATRHIRVSCNGADAGLSLIHISEPTRQAEISYAVFCLKKKKKKEKNKTKQKNKKKKDKK